MAKLSDAMLTTMNRAAQRPDGLLSPAPKTPTHMALAMAEKLVAADMAERIDVSAEEPHYTRGEDGEFRGYRLSIQGFMALGITSSEWPDYCQPDFAAHDAEEEALINAGGPDMPRAWEAPLEDERTTDVQEIAADRAAYRAEQEAELASMTAVEAQEALEAKLAPLVTPGNAKLALRAAAEAALAAWALAQTAGSEGMAIETLQPAMLNLRIALGEPKAAKPARAAKPAGDAKAPRQGTKQQTVIDMLRSADGAGIDDIMHATGWQQHTVRGFFAGLKKKGMNVASVKQGDIRTYRIEG